MGDTTAAAPPPASAPIHPAILHGRMCVCVQVQNIFEIARQGEEKRFGKHQNNHNRCVRESVSHQSGLPGAAQPTLQWWI